MLIIMSKNVKKRYLILTPAHKKDRIYKNIYLQFSNSFLAIRKLIANTLFFGMHCSIIFL